ncbi:hypothetical protein ACR42D_01280 [Desulfovibrio caledoniensis]
MKRCIHALVLFSLLLLTGCASSQMMQLPEGVAPYTASPDKSTVVFMRPSAFGGAVQSYAVQYDNETPEFIGIVSTNYKIAFQTSPGEHLFMIMRENTDYLKADLAANHIYYVIVEPHLGFMKTRFSLEPVTASQLDTQDFKDDLAECSFVQNTPESMKWFEDNRGKIMARYRSSYQDWLADPEDQSHLLKADGRALSG